MSQTQIAHLIASANELDNRLGPIPGRSSDRIANELRWAAAELQAKREATAAQGSEDKSDRWLAPEEFAALSPRDRVHYTIKMLGSVNLTQDACNRQARRITDALESAGLIPTATQPAHPTPVPEKEASPTDVARFLAGALHNVLAHFDTLPLDEYFAAAQSGNKFASALEKINAEVSSALSVAGVHPMFETFGDEQSCPGHVASPLNPKICANCGVHIDSLRPPEDQPEGSK